MAPSNPDHLWAGTGEPNSRNSVSWGDGVWRSTDGGKSWSHAGLAATHHIGRVVVHPRDPDTVYVAALGRTWGPSEARGLYKTTDGGKRWNQVLYVDADTGAVDVILHPRDPEVIFAATYHRRRDEFDVNDPAQRWGPGSALWKSSDGGANWIRLSGPGEHRGLPTVLMGRCGIDICLTKPDIWFAVVETELIGQALEGSTMPPLTGPAYMGVNGEDAPDGAGA
ncbi:MAG: WD40/YVTN/BNR-like repeat-containing protein, partial [Planctomycetota bacterium]